MDFELALTASSLRILSGLTLSIERFWLIPDPSPCHPISSPRWTQKAQEDRNHHRHVILPKTRCDTTTDGDVRLFVYDLLRRYIAILGEHDACEKAHE